MQIISEDFQDRHHCCHLGYRNEIVLAILNLHHTPMPPTRFWLNQTYHSGADVVWRFSRWLQWTSEQKDFSNSESLCLPSNCGSIQLKVWEKMLFEEFQDGNIGDHLGYHNRTILAILNFHATQLPPAKFGLNPTQHSGTDMVWRFSRWLSWWPSWIPELLIFAILNLRVPSMPPKKFQLNPT